MEPTENKINIVAEKNSKKYLHYHGDKVRSIYLLIVMILIIATPFFKYRLLAGSYLAIIAVVGFSIFAGLTNPLSRKILIIDFIISMVAVFIFGQQTILAYTGTYSDLFFLTNLVLFILSTLSLYFSSKTLRGNLLYKGQ